MHYLFAAKHRDVVRMVKNTPSAKKANRTTLNGISINRSSK